MHGEGGPSVAALQWQPFDLPSMTQTFQGRRMLSMQTDAIDEAPIKEAPLLNEHMGC